MANDVNARGGIPFNYVDGLRVKGVDIDELVDIKIEAAAYVHPTTDGSLHVPATDATSNMKVLAAGSTAGSIAWQTLDPTYMPDATFKKSVKVATTAALTAAFASGTLTNSGALTALSIDSVGLSVADRVLVKDQTAPLQNGIYVVTNVGTTSVAWVLTRAADADIAAEIAGACVSVDTGVTNGGIRFDTNFKTTDALNTADITWNRMVDTGFASSDSAAELGTAAAGASLNYARADHVHQLPRLDQLADPIASVSLNSQKLISVAAPTNNSDAATKGYVDGVAQGLAIKDSVVAATTANITLSAPQTIDDIAVVAGDRVLVKNQTTAYQNGIYVVNAGAWTRSLDADEWTELASSFVFVERGTINASSGWTCTSDSGGTLGVTAVTWSQFSGAGQIIAGGGLTKIGNQIDAVGTAGRITVNADSIDIASTYVGQNTITTLGTVTTGTWNASTIAVNRGGTGVATISGIIKGNGTNAFSVAESGTDYLAPDSVIDGGTY